MKTTTTDTTRRKEADDALFAILYRYYNVLDMQKIIVELARKGGEKES